MSRPQVKIRNWTRGAAAIQDIYMKLIINTKLITMTSHERHIVSNYWSFDCLFNSVYLRNIKVHITGRLWGELTDDRWIPRTKGQWCWTNFHMMTSSCCETTYIHKSCQNSLKLLRWLLIQWWIGYGPIDVITDTWNINIIWSYFIPNDVFRRSYFLWQAMGLIFIWRFLATSTWAHLRRTLGYMMSSCFRKWLLLSHPLEAVSRI